MKGLYITSIVTLFFSFSALFGLPKGALAQDRCVFSCDRIFHSDKVFQDRVFQRDVVFTGLDDFKTFRSRDTIFFPVDSRRLFPAEPIVFDPLTRVKIFRDLRPASVDFIFENGSPIPVAVKPNFGSLDLGELGGSLFPRTGRLSGDIIFHERRSRFLGSDVIFW